MACTFSNLTGGRGQGSGMEGMRRLASGCHGRGSRALPRDDAPPAWSKPVSHVPAEQRVRERGVQDGHGEPVAMARTLRGARARQGGRERLHGVPPLSRGAHRPSPAAGGRGAAGGGKGRVHFLYSVRGTRAAGPHHARDATLRGRGEPGRRTPAARAGAAGTCSRGRCPSRKRCGHGRRCSSKEGEMERSGMRRQRCADRRGGLDESSAERHRGPARRAGVR